MNSSTEQKEAARPSLHCLGRWRAVSSEHLPKNGRKIVLYVPPDKYTEERLLVVEWVNYTGAGETWHGDTNGMEYATHWISMSELRPLNVVVGPEKRSLDEMRKAHQEADALVEECEALPQNRKPSLDWFE